MSADYEGGREAVGGGGVVVRLTRRGDGVHNVRGARERITQPPMSS